MTAYSDLLKPDVVETVHTIQRSKVFFCNTPACSSLLLSTTFTRAITAEHSVLLPYIAGGLPSLHNTLTIAQKCLRILVGDGLFSTLHFSHRRDVASNQLIYRYFHRKCRLITLLFSDSSNPHVYDFSPHTTHIVRNNLHYFRILLVRCNFSSSRFFSRNTAL